MKKKYNNERHNNSQTVINKLQEGYQCVGGISVVKTLPTHGVGASYGGVEYYQSMILKEDEKTKKVL